MKPRIRSTFVYDVTREMKRLLLGGRLNDRFPEQASAITKALRQGGRIVFAPDEDDFYQEFEMDEFFHDPRTGRTRGARRI